MIDPNVSNWSGRSLRCGRCGLVDETTIGGLCSDCTGVLNTCDRCGATGVKTKPYRLADAEALGLYGVSRFCSTCGKNRSAGYVETLG